MWNYYFLFHSLLVLTVFLGFYLTMPRISVALNRTYLWMLSLQTLTMAIDLFASRVCEIHDILPWWFVYFLNLFYFLLLMLRDYCFHLYALELLRLEEKTRPWRYALSLVLVISQVWVLSNLFTGHLFSILEEGYVTGPYYNLLYVFMLIQALLCLIPMLLNQGVLNRFERISAYLFHGLMLGGVLMRYVFPNILIQDTFCVMSIIVIYLSFENPDLYLSARTGTFNNRALEELLGEWVGRRPFRILALIIHNYSEYQQLYGPGQMERGTNMIGQYLNSFKDVQVFYLRGGRFVLLGDESMPWERIQEDISNQFLKPWVDEDSELYLEMDSVFISSEVEFQNAQELIKVIKILGVKTTNGGLHGRVFGREQLKDMKNQIFMKRILESALDHNRVDIFLQPLVDAKTFEIKGAEALARVRDENGEIIYPAEFISIAEQNGSIIRLGEQVLHKACLCIRHLDELGLPLPCLHVNLSPIQCLSLNIVERFEGILQETGVSADRIRLEITEQSMINPELLKSQMEKLQELGFLFSLDDFGSGYSSLNMARHFSFISIKLDMEVVWDHFANPDAILPTFVQVFREKGYGIIAEGVETMEMATELGKFGCDYLQGFLFSRPIPQNEFVELLRKNKQRAF